MSVWTRIAHGILDHRGVVLLGIAVLTAWLGYWAFQVKTDHTAGQFVPAESASLQDFRRAGQVFGESRTLLYLVFEGADPYDRAFLQACDTLTRQVTGFEGVERVLSLTNMPYLVRVEDALVAEPLYTPDLPDEEVRRRVRDQRFLRGLLLSDDGVTAAMLVKIDRAFNDTPARLDLVARIETAARRMPGTVALAGFPYVRTEYARRITREAPLFTGLALLVSLAFLYLTFRTRRAVLLPTAIVGLGIVWTLGCVALLDHRLTIVTAILPALLVVIGMANAIHLCTAFFDHYDALQDRREALVETIRTVGLATFLASATTAIGFAVLMLSGSPLLAAFGQVTALGIMILYVLSITLIPLAFLVQRPPGGRGKALATHDAFARAFDRLAGFTQRRAPALFVATAAVTLVGLGGVTRLSSDVFVFSDFFEDDPLRRDLAVFEARFGGVLPMEVVIEARTPQTFRTLGALQRLDQLRRELHALQPVGRTLAATDLVKLANQAYFGGHPAAYRLPSRYELPFLQTAWQDALGPRGGSAWSGSLPSLLDSTLTVTRILLGVPDLGTERMNALADTARARATTLFPEDRFEVYVTGSAVMTTRRGESLVRNLLVSLAVALVLISALMALLFRSARLMIISLLPNVIPLLVVGGAMGYFGIALKPSTALIFSVAFGIAVDDTIHFLAKYRLHRNAGQPREAAVTATLHETGKAILFTSLVLMGGFLVFTLSGFGGTVTMGALTALTLAGALAANLVLLPALLYRYGPEAHAPPRRVNRAPGA